MPRVAIREREDNPVLPAQGAIGEPAEYPGIQAIAGNREPLCIPALAAPGMSGKLITFTS